MFVSSNRPKDTFTHAKTHSVQEKNLNGNFSSVNVFVVLYNCDKALPIGWVIVKKKKRKKRRRKKKKSEKKIRRSIILLTHMAKGRKTREKDRQKRKLSGLSVIEENDV